MEKEQLLKLGDITQRLATISDTQLKTAQDQVVALSQVTNQV